MKDYYYDPTTKDLTLTTLKDLAFSGALDEYTAQKIEKKLSFLLGEWYLNTTVGVPYLAQNNNDRDDNTKNMFVKNPNIPWINSQFIQQLNDISTIKSVLAFSTSLDTNIRKFTVQYTVLLIDGTSYEDILQVGVL